MEPKTEMIDQHLVPCRKPLGTANKGLKRKFLVEYFVAQQAQNEDPVFFNLNQGFNLWEQLLSMLAGLFQSPLTATGRQHHGPSLLFSLYFLEHH